MGIDEIFVRSRPRFDLLVDVATSITVDVRFNDRSSISCRRNCVSVAILVRRSSFVEAGFKCNSLSYCCFFLGVVDDGVSKSLKIFGSVAVAVITVVVVVVVVVLERLNNKG